MNKKKLLSLIITICMVMLFVPTIAYADEVIINGDPINTEVKDYSVDASSISVDLIAVLRNAETGEEKSLGIIDKITPENVTFGTYETVKTNAIEEGKTKLNEWLEMMRQANPDVKFTAAGDMSVKGNDVVFDNRTYTMKGNGDDNIIIGDEASGSTTSGSQTTSRYMEVTGNYGKTGSYSVTMTVDVQGGAYFFTEDGNGAASDLDKSPQTDNSNMTELWILLFFISGAGIAGTTIYSRKKNYSAK